MKMTSGTKEYVEILLAKKRKEKEEERQAEERRRMDVLLESFRL